MTQSFDQSIKVCFVHDWLVGMRGGEKVLEALVDLFPNAPIYTLFLDRPKLSQKLQTKDIKTSFLQKIPGANQFYRWLLPLFPLAVRCFDLNSYDVIISSSHCVAKGARAKKGAVHICYCHTPMRYLWGFEGEYFGHFPKWIRLIIQKYFDSLKKWDIKTSKKVDAFIANSQNTANKIKNLYDKEAVVIHPPVDVHERGDHESINEGTYYLIVSALVPYKRIDLAIQAFNQLKLPLKIIGNGPERAKLIDLITHPEIDLLGWIIDENLRNYYANCKAVIFPGEEDFGIVPVEAQMFGKPVVVFGKGGVLETVLAVNEKGVSRSPQEGTGFFFYEQDVGKLVEAIQEFERLEFNPDFIRNHALQFSSEQFRHKITEFLKCWINEGV